MPGYKGNLKCTVPFTLIDRCPRTLPPGPLDVDAERAVTSCCRNQGFIALRITGGCRVLTSKVVSLNHVQHMGADYAQSR